MRLLVIGGAGYVGGLILPRLAEHHTVRVLDLRPPRFDCEHVLGDATDPAVLARAVSGVDAVVHSAMAHKDQWTDSAADAAASFDVNVKSVHLALRAAHEAGVPHAVVTSSMSVYRDLLGRTGITEDDPPDAWDTYGLSKRLGEQVCAAAVAGWGMSVTVLRLAFPTSDDLWPAWHRPGDGPVVMRTPAGEPVPGTAASDLARAVLAALEYRDGLAVFAIAGDHDGRVMDLRKARDLLGWQPRRGRIR